MGLGEAGGRGWWISDLRFEISKAAELALGEGAGFGGDRKVLRVES